MVESDEGRRFLKSDRWEEWAGQETDQRLGRPRPPFQKPYPAGSLLMWQSHRPRRIADNRSR